MNKLLKTTAALSTVAAMLLAQTQPVNAQAFRGLVINEVKFEIDKVEPGATIQRSFKLLHDFQDKESIVTVYLHSLDFESDGKTGNPQFVKPDKLGKSASLAKWITFEKESVVLDGYGDEEVINFTINVPENAEPGGKYAAVLLTDQAGQSALIEEIEGSQLGLSKELGPLVLLTVDGDIAMGMDTESLYTTDINDKKKTWFFNGLPVNITSVFKNKGNIHQTAKGSLFVYKGKNFQDYVAKFDINKEGGYVLPDSTREFTETWDDGFIVQAVEENEEGKKEVVTQVNWDKLSKFRLGQYKVKLLYTSPNETGETQTYEADTSFWVFPWWLILAIVAIIGTVSLYLWNKTRVKSSKSSSKKNSK